MTKKILSDRTGFLSDQNSLTNDLLIEKNYLEACGRVTVFSGITCYIINCFKHQKSIVPALHHFSNKILFPGLHQISLGIK